MSSTVFVDHTTVIPAAWCNEVNGVTFSASGVISKNIQMVTPVEMQNTGNNRVTFSSAGAFPVGSDIAYQADAHRFHRKLTSWSPASAGANDASFVFQSDVNNVTAFNAPIHGGVWSILYASGTASTGFALMGSGHRGPNGSMYAVHGEIWDLSTNNPALCVVFNAETAQLPANTCVGSTYIMYNAQAGDTATGIIGVQLQAQGSLSNNWDSAMKLMSVTGGVWNGRVGLDFVSSSFSDAFLALPSSATTATATALLGYIKVMVNGTSCRIPYYSA